ncbi:hypothetical protein DPSP01_008218 [Paraphaeosphaeria sporulosa]
MEAKEEDPRAEVIEAADGAVHQEVAVRIKWQEIQEVEVSVVGTGADNNIKVEEEALKTMPYFNTNLSPAHPNPAHCNPPTNYVPPLDPGAFAQAMAFMATPAGMQTMAAFAANMVNGSANPTCDQPVPPQQPTLHGQSSNPQPSPRKRQRNERVERWQPQQPPKHNHPPIQKAPAQSAPSQKPPRAKAKAPPSIPGFGFSLPPVPQHTDTLKAGGAHHHHQKRVKLGLTSLNCDEESSSEDDDNNVDEEALLAAKWDGKGMTFEHNGETISLQTAAEFAEYIKDRKTNFPTQQRAAEKAHLAAERRANEIEFLRRVKGTPGKGRPGGEAKSKDQRKGKAANKYGSLKPRPEELREKARNSMASKHAAAKPPSDSSAQQSIDLGLGYRTDTESDDASSILSESSVVSSDESSEGAASEAEADEASDSDALPEAQSSKIIAAPRVPQPPPRLPAPRAETSSKSQAGVCQQWKMTGRCKYKYCRNKHGEEEPKSMGLYERMVEQELDKADRLALEAIKYLGRNGFLG